MLKTKGAAPDSAKQGPGATDRDCNTGPRGVLGAVRIPSPIGFQAAAGMGRAARAATPTPTSAADTTLRPRVTAEP